MTKRSDVTPEEPIWLSHVSPEQQLRYDETPTKYKYQLLLSWMSKLAIFGPRIEEIMYLEFGGVTTPEDHGYAFEELDALFRNITESQVLALGFYNGDDPYSAKYDVELDTDFDEEPAEPILGGRRDTRPN